MSLAEQFASIPESWPTPGNQATRVRVFAIDIARPVSGSPTLTSNFNEAIDAGGKTFEQAANDLRSSIDLVSALADPEIAEASQAVLMGLSWITYVQYLRRKAELEA